MQRTISELLARWREFAGEARRLLEENAALRDEVARLRAELAQAQYWGGQSTTPG